ncbi:MAG: class I SAM-dependent methyltransferase [Alphaproteobacteria bacterium]|nr:class I SAM-dependent methyltransferase [Alphaproteobacteria bacterium]
MKECSKSILRRLADPNFLSRYFVGRGIDIGGAPDPLPLYRELFPRMGEVRVWDQADGNAETLAGVADESFDFVHSSHCLEHLVDPAQGLVHWFRVLKAGGHLIVTVPEEDLYEQGVFPSTYNRDHRHTFTLRKERSWSPRSRNLLDLLPGLGAAADVRKVEVIDAAHRYALPRFDQTLTPVAESAIELVVRKRTPPELAAGGRLPASARALSAQEIWLLTGLRPRGGG